MLAAKRQEILDARDAQAALKKPANASTLPVNDEVNEVKIVDRSYYMSKAFKAQDQEAQALIDTTAKEFSLNEAQERAFRIVANHAVESNGEHLKMCRAHIFLAVEL